MQTRTVVRGGPERDALFSLLRGRASLRFLFFGVFPWLIFGRQFAAFFRGPAGLIGLAAARDPQSVRGDIFCDCRTRRDVCPIADSNGCDQRRIAPDERFIPYPCWIFVEAVVVAGDRAGANVRFRAGLGIAEIREVHRLGAFADGALLQLDEIADARIGFQMIVWAEARERADDHAVVETALRHDAMRLDRHVITESRVAENASRSNG